MSPMGQVTLLYQHLNFFHQTFGITFVPYQVMSSQLKLLKLLQSHSVQLFYIYNCKEILNCHKKFEN